VKYPDTYNNILLLQRISLTHR